MIHAYGVFFAFSLVWLSGCGAGLLFCDILYKQRGR